MLPHLAQSPSHTLSSSPALFFSLESWGSKAWLSSFISPNSTVPKAFSECAAPKGHPEPPDPASAERPQMHEFRHLQRQPRTPRTEAKQGRIQHTAFLSRVLSSGRRLLASRHAITGTEGHRHGRLNRLFRRAITTTKHPQATRTDSVLTSGRVCAAARAQFRRGPDSRLPDSLSAPAACRELWSWRRRRGGRAWQEAEAAGGPSPAPPRRAARRRAITDVSLG